MADVVTSGTGQHEQLADRAELWVSLTGRGTDRTSAVDELAARVRAVDPLLEVDGVVVRSRRLGVHVDWERSRRSGYRAEVRLHLRVERPEVLDELLAGLVAAGPESLDGPHWRLADDAGATAAAQREAVLDARRRAEAYAAALGMRLGPLLRIADAGAGAGAAHAETMAIPIAASFSGRSAVAELGLEPLPVTVTASCTTTWSLLE